MVFVAVADSWVDETVMYGDWGYSGSWPYDGGVLAATAVEGQGIFEVIVGGAELTAVSAASTSLFGGALPIPLSGSGVSVAAAASWPKLGVATSIGQAVITTVDLQNGAASQTATLSAPGEEVIGPVGAASCSSSFAFAYAVTGGNVMLRGANFDGTLPPGGSTLVANLGEVSAQSIALVATDDGLLLAVGTPAQIGVYLLACP
jgi:hypothetical protein